MVLSNLLINIKKNFDEGQQLLVHPLVESFILLKWRIVERWFLAQFFITFFFVVAYSLFSSVKCLRNGADDSIVFGFLIVLAPFLLEIILFEVFLFYGQDMRYHFKQSLIPITAILTTLINMCTFNYECTGFYRNVYKFNFYSYDIFFDFRFLQYQPCSSGFTSSL